MTGPWFLALVLIWGLYGDDDNSERRTSAGSLGLPCLLADRTRARRGAFGVLFVGRGIWRDVSSVNARDFRRYYRLRDPQVIRELVAEIDLA